MVIEPFTRAIALKVALLMDNYQRVGWLPSLMVQGCVYVNG